MAGRLWTNGEITRLIKNYGSGCRRRITKSLSKRSWSSIKLKAAQLGLAFTTGVHEYVAADLKVLMQDTPLAYYWMGFLMADGTFLKSQRLKLLLAHKDKSHVKKFAKFIKCQNHRSQKRGYGVAVQDQFWIPKIRAKFDLKPSKTYYPPDDIGWIKGNLFVAFFIGFVDGDGRIARQSGGRKDCFLTVKNHRSWHCIHKQMCDILVGITKQPLNGPYFDKEGYSLFNLCRRSTLKFLKSKCIELHLPVLIRKWKKIR